MNYIDIRFGKQANADVFMQKHGDNSEVLRLMKLTFSRIAADHGITASLDIQTATVRLSPHSVQALPDGETGISILFGWILEATILAGELCSCDEIDSSD